MNSNRLLTEAVDSFSGNDTTAVYKRAVEVDHPLMRVIGPPVAADPPDELKRLLARVEGKYGEFYKD